MVDTDRAELRILRKKPVARVYCIRTRDLGSGDDAIHPQIAVAGRRGPDADGFVREAHMQRIAVGRRVNGDRIEAHFVARSDDSERYLTPVGDQDLLHANRIRFEPSGSTRQLRLLRQAGSMAKRGWSNSTG